MTIVFIGDIHQHWHYRPRRPRRADRPCRAPPCCWATFSASGRWTNWPRRCSIEAIAVHWIHGNHDNDGGPEMWANLAAPERNPLTASGGLHARVVEIEGIRIAGLGGTFRPPVWSPPSPPRLRHRHQLADDLAGLGPVYGPTATRGAGALAEHLRHLAGGYRGACVAKGRHPGDPRGAQQPSVGQCGASMNWRERWVRG